MIKLIAKAFYKHVKLQENPIKKTMQKNYLPTLKKNYQKIYAFTSDL